MALMETDIAAVLDLPGRPLEVRELREVAERIAAREDVWRPFIDFAADDRHYESLYVDEHVGIWVICWPAGADTGFHDHDGSRGGVAVAAAQIREERPVWGRQPRRIDARAGQSFGFDETEIHRMVNLHETTAVTIHAYSLPLTSMGMYRVEDDDYVRRCAVDWDQKLEA